MINIKCFFKYIANEGKNNIDQKILSSKVDDINFFDRYNTLYNYLNDLFESGAEESSIKNKTFLKDLSKWFKLKSVYTIQDENNIEKAYDDLVFSNKEVDNVLYKNVNNEISNRNKIYFSESKKVV